MTRERFAFRFFLVGVVAYLSVAIFLVVKGADWASALFLSIFVFAFQVLLVHPIMNLFEEWGWIDD